MRRIFPLALLLASACLYTFLETDEVPVSRAAAGLTALELSTASGEVAVTGTAADTIAGRATRKAWGRTRADARAALGSIELTDTVEGTTAKLAARLPDARRPLGCGFALAVPESLALTITATLSPVSVAGISAPVSITTSSAGVSVTRTRGELSVATASGPVNLLDTEGTAALSTRSAPIKVQVHRGPLDAVTSNGPVECELARLGPVESARLETKNAPITLYLPADVSARVTARTTSGTITFHGFTVRYEVQRPDSVVGIIGTGASAVDLATTNGNITVQAR